MHFQLRCPPPLDLRFMLIIATHWQPMRSDLQPHQFWRHYLWRRRHLHYLRLSLSHINGVPPPSSVVSSDVIPTIFFVFFAHICLDMNDSCGFSSSLMVFLVQIWSILQPTPQIYNILLQICHHTAATIVNRCYCWWPPPPLTSSQGVWCTSTNHVRSYVCL